MRLICLMLFSVFFGMTSAASDEAYEADFMRDLPLKRLPAPTELGKTYTLWATRYYTPLYNVGGDYVLAGMDDIELKYKGQPAALSHRQYCNAAMEGSVHIIFAGGTGRTFNYSGVKEPARIDCSPYFGDRFPQTDNVRFREARSAWGDGAHDAPEEYSLIPFRTIAVNPHKIPYGSVLFIADAVGTRIRLAGGKTFIHDGYFFAADTGGAMRRDGNHIDVFVGTEDYDGFDFIHSNANRTFKARLVKDRKVIEALTDIHLAVY